MPFHALLLQMAFEPFKIKIRIPQRVWLGLRVPSRVPSPLRCYTKHATVIPTGDQFCQLVDFRMHLMPPPMSQIAKIRRLQFLRRLCPPDWRRPSADCAWTKDSLVLP